MKQISRYLEPHRFTSLTYQAFFIIITTCATLFFIYEPLANFEALEQPSQIMPIDQLTIKKWGTSPTRIKTGLVVTHVLKFDMLRDNFILTLLLWFDFDPAHVEKSVIEQVTFLKGTLVDKEMSYKKIDEHTTRAFYYITLEFNESLDYHRFPLDDHLLSLRLTNPTISPRQIWFDAEPNNFLFLKKIYLPGWTLVKLNVKPGYRTWPLDSTNPHETVEQGMINFELGFSKADPRNVLIVLIPLLFVFFIGLLSFSTNKQDIAMGLNLASITGLIAYAYIIQSVSPDVSEFMISDLIFLFCFFGSFLIFLFNILYSPHPATEKKILTFKGLVVLASYVSLIAFWYYLTNMYYIVS